MLMKKWFVGLVLAVLIGTCSLSIYAAPGKIEIHIGNFNGGGHHQIREDARYVIHRSAMVIFAARRAVEYRHRYFGLARAIAHQQRARELYENGSYREAIFHSLHARELAIQIIRGNRGKMRPDFFRDEKEERYARDLPRDSELDLRVKEKVGNDDDAVHWKFDLDVDQ
jgi:hypothetical protein